MKLLEHQDGEKFLFMPTKFRRWLISTLDRALANLRAELAKYGIQKVFLVGTYVFFQLFQWILNITDYEERVWTSHYSDY